MRWVSRREWGARNPKNRTVLASPQGETFHYVGARLGLFPHSQCAARVRNIQKFHMDTRGWADIAYNTLTCPHGWVFEGRGWGLRSGANGTNAGNGSSYANCHLSGDGDPLTDEGKQAMRDVLHAARTTGRAGNRVWVHGDWKATGCPGNAVTQFVRSGFAGEAPAPQVEIQTVTPPVPTTRSRCMFMAWHKGVVWLFSHDDRGLPVRRGWGLNEEEVAGFKAMGVPLGGEVNEATYKACRAIWI